MAVTGLRMSVKPLIGVPADRRMLDPHPFHVVGEKYLTAVRDGADALPLTIPALGASIHPDDILARIDGLLLTGSYSNVEPHHYDGKPSRPGTLHDPHRDETTLALIDSLAPRVVVPGHGRIPEDPTELTHMTRSYVTSLRDSMRAEVRRGTSMRRAVEAFPPPDTARPVSPSSRIRRNAVRVYLEMEREAFGLDEQERP